MAATGDMVAEVVAELAEQRSTWGRTDALRLVTRRLPPALLPSADEARAWIEAGADAVVADRSVVALAAPAQAEVPDELCRRDGLPTTERHGRARYTTRATLALEADVIDFAGRGREAGVAIASSTAVERAVVSAGLGEDQVAAVRRVCGGGEAMVCLVGPAGAGKTRSVGAARAAWVITQRRRDGSLVVDHADGRGRVVLPGDYVAEHVALSYAVTVTSATQSWS